MTSKLHIDNISNIDSQQISRFINTGLCYIKTSEDIFKCLIDIRNQSLVFFHLPSDDKDLYPITVW